MIKNYVMKKLLQRQLKDVPKDQQEMFMKAFEEDPKLFEEISKEMKAEMKGGKDQMTAAMKVMPKYQARLQAAMGGVERRENPFSPNGRIRR